MACLDDASDNVAIFFLAPSNFLTIIFIKSFSHKTTQIFTHPFRNYFLSFDSKKNTIHLFSLVDLIRVRF